MYLSQVNKAMRRAGKSAEEIKEVLDDAQSGDYNHLREVCASAMCAI